MAMKCSRAFRHLLIAQRRPTSLRNAQISQARHVSSSAKTAVSTLWNITLGALGGVVGAGAHHYLQKKEDSVDSSLEHDGIKYASRAQMLNFSLSAIFAHSADLTTTQAAMEIADSLKDEDVVSYDEDVIENHGHSEWSTSSTKERPVAVVYPRSTEDVVMIARICSEHNVPMVPFGAGSSVEGNFSSPYSGICIDFTYMDKIIAFHPEDLLFSLGSTELI